MDRRRTRYSAPYSMTIRGLSEIREEHDGNRPQDHHALTDLQDRWIKAQIAAGHFTNDSEYCAPPTPHAPAHRYPGCATVC